MAKETEIGRKLYMNSSILASAKIRLQASTVRSLLSFLWLIVTSEYQRDCINFKYSWKSRAAGGGCFGWCLLFFFPMGTTVSNKGTFRRQNSDKFQDGEKILFPISTGFAVKTTPNPFYIQWDALTNKLICSSKLAPDLKILPYVNNP